MEIKMNGLQISYTLMENVTILFLWIQGVCGYFQKQTKKTIALIDYALPRVVRNEWRGVARCECDKEDEWWNYSIFLTGSKQEEAFVWIAVSGACIARSKELRTAYIKIQNRESWGSLWMVWVLLWMKTGTLTYVKQAKRTLQSSLGAWANLKLRLAALNNYFVVIGFTGAKSLF